MIWWSAPPNSTSMMAMVWVSFICSFVTFGFASGLSPFFLSELKGFEEFAADLLFGVGGGWFSWARAAGARSSAMERRQKGSDFMSRRWFAIGGVKQVV